MVRMVGNAWLLLLAGCLFYDSRWGDTERAQRNYAQRQTAADLEPEQTTWSRVAKVRIRVYTDAAYRRAHADAAVSASELIARANQTLAGTLKTKLEIVDVREFDVTSSGQNLKQVLEQVRTLDAGDDVDVVLAIVGASPQFTESFHELGYAAVLGHHMTLRDLHHDKEYEHFVKDLDELDEAERLRLFRNRRNHKQTAVLLHEFGHVLGAIHTTEASTLMQPAYDYTASHFAEPNLVLMRQGLSYLLADRDTANGAVVLEKLANLVKEAKYTFWVADERAEYAEDLEQALEENRKQSTSVVAQPTAEASTSSPPRSMLSSEVSEVADLDEADQKDYASAVEAFRGGATEAAWRLAAPLADRTKDSYATQHLACEVGMRGRMAMSMWRTYCTRVTNLATQSTQPAAQ